jgi:hypothetical protein
MDGTFVFQAFFSSYIDLGWQPVPFSEDWCTDHSRVVGLDEGLATDDDE